MLTKDLTNRQKDILNQIKTIQDFEFKHYYWLYEILKSYSQQYKQIIEDTIKTRNVNAKKSSIFELLNNRNDIPKETIVLSWKLLAEKLIELSSELETKIDLSISEKDIDVIDGVICINQNIKREAVPMYDIQLDKIKKIKPNQKAVFITYDFYQDLITRQARHKAGDNESFTLLDILKDAYRKGTSDIHINYGELYTVHFRIHGILVQQHQYTMNKDRFALLSEQIAQRTAKDTGVSFNANNLEVPQGGIVKYDSLKLDLRIEFTPSGFEANISKITGRILKRGGSTGTLDKLRGYKPAFIEMLTRATYYTSGLFLVAGVTNSGKSTLTSHFIMSTPETKSVMCFEDPIEYQKPKPNITQHQMFEKGTGDKLVVVKAKEYIKSAKRDDPDITEIGEIRKDKELVDAISESAKAGNFVIATIHINSAFDVPKALVSEFDMNIASVGDILKLIVNQILVQKLCPHCKLEDKEGKNKAILKDFYDRGDVNYAWTKDLKDFLDEECTTYLLNEKGCNHCNYQGISGLVPIYEYLKLNPKAVQWLGTSFIDKSKYEIEEYFCSQEDENMAVNKLTTYIEALKRGDVDTSMDTVTKVLL